MKKTISRRYDGKLFSNEMLFSNAGIPHRHSELFSAHVMPLSAVLLMNSPSLGDWEWQEYARLSGAYRGNIATAPESQGPRGTSKEDTVLPCYFICADGAYSSLKRRWEAERQECVNPHHHSSSSASHQYRCDLSRAQQMPDVVIGDMDSCEPDDLPPEMQQQQQQVDPHSHAETQMKMESVVTLTEDTDLHKMTPRDASSPVGCSASAPSASSARRPPSQLHFFPTVSDIPVEMLAAIRERAISRLLLASHEERTEENGASCTQRAHHVHGVPPPFFFRIGCQMTTDFQKVMMLLERLEQAFPLDFPRFQRCSTNPADAPFTHVAEDGLLAQGVQHAYCQAKEQLLATMEERVVGAWVDGVSEEGLAAERARIVTLLNSATGESLSPTTTTSSSSGMERSNATRGSSASSSDTVVTLHLLPNVAVFGAIGGRFDHEMGAMSCVLEYAQRYHVMLTNPHNVITACWPDGLTQWIPYNQPHPTHPGDNHPGDNHPVTSSSEKEGKRHEGTWHGEKSGGCGVIPMGTVREMETNGFLYNIVNGRPSRYDGVTQTSGYRFAFGGLLSACNTVNAPIVTVDLRRTEPPLEPLPGKPLLHPSHEAPHSHPDDTYNPPTLLTCSRQ